MRKIMLFALVVLSLVTIVTMILGLTGVISDKASLPVIVSLALSWAAFDSSLVAVQAVRG